LRNTLLRLPLNGLLLGFSAIVLSSTLRDLLRQACGRDYRSHREGRLILFGRHRCRSYVGEYAGR